MSAETIDYAIQTLDMWEGIVGVVHGLDAERQGEYWDVKRRHMQMTVETIAAMRETLGVGFWDNAAFDQLAKDVTKVMSWNSFYGEDGQKQAAGTNADDV